MCLLLLLPSCSAAQSLPSSAWERQMTSKNHKGATQSPMSSSLFSHLSQSSSLLPYSSSSSSSPCCPSHFAGCTEHFAPLLPAVLCSLLACLLSHTDVFFVFFPHLEVFSLLSVSPCLVLSVFVMMGPWQKKWLQAEVVFFPPPSSPSP